jgi:hypothetical protein
MKALIKEPITPVTEKATNGVTLRRLLYGAIIVCVLILAVLSAFGRLSMMMDVHEWLFGR